MSYADDVCDFELRKHDTYDHKSNSTDFLVQYAYISARRKANGILRIALKNFPTDCSSLMSPS